MSSLNFAVKQSDPLAYMIHSLMKYVIFPSNSNTAELSTTLFHNDLSMQNILVDRDGNITGVVDWECVSALPLWRACAFPEFLDGTDRNEEPRRDSYAPDSGEKDNDGLDNEGENSLYWHNLLDFELMMLRDVFLKEMGNVAPRWIEEFEKGADKADFEVAVQNCDNGWVTKRVKSWLDALEKGEKFDLRRSFFE